MLIPLIEEIPCYQRMDLVLSLEEIGSILDEFGVASVIFITPQKTLEFSFSFLPERGEKERIFFSMSV